MHLYIERKSEVQLVVRDMKIETVWELTVTLIWDPLLILIMKIHMLKDMQITVKMYKVSKFFNYMNVQFTVETNVL